MRLFDVAVVMLFACAECRIALATDCVIHETGTLVAWDSVEFDQYGDSMAVSGGVVIIGAQLNDNENGKFAGAAYVYRLDGNRWMREAKLIASDGSASDRFGSAIGLCGDVAVIGASVDDDHGPNSGSAYVFRYDGASWVEEAKLTPSDAGPDDNFGAAVSVSGDAVIIGAPNSDGNGPIAGKAYIFRCDGTAWTEEARLANTTVLTAIPYWQTTNNWFGDSVAIDGDVAIVGGAWVENFYGADFEAACVYRYDGRSWNEEAKLTVQSPVTDIDQFARSVSISGDVAVVGAYNDQVNGTYAGSAHVFRHDGTSWSHEARLIASNGTCEGGFGGQVNVNGDTILVAASDYDGDGGDGIAYIYRYGGAGDHGEPGHVRSRTEDMQLLPSDFGLGFVGAIALGDGVAFVGATFTAYFFDVGDVPCAEAAANGDDRTVASDLRMLFEAWGPSDGHPADVTGDGQVDSNDLIAILADSTP